MPLALPACEGRSVMPLFRRLDGLQPYAPLVTAMEQHVAAMRDGAQRKSGCWNTPVLTGGTSAQMQI